MLKRKNPAPQNDMDCGGEMTHRPSSSSARTVSYYYFYQYYYYYFFYHYYCYYNKFRKTVTVLLLIFTIGPREWKAELWGCRTLVLLFFLTVHNHSTVTTLHDT